MHYYGATVESLNGVHQNRCCHNKNCPSSQKVYKSLKDDDTERKHAVPTLPV